MSSEGRSGRDSCARSAAGIGMALLMSGCAAVGPDFARPSTPEVKAWVAANDLSPSSGSGFTARSAPVAAWWQTFDDQLLSQLVAEAYAQNLSLQVAGARVLQARAQLGVAYGELFPQSQSIGGSRSSRRVSENLQFVSDVERVADLDLNFVDYQVGFDAAWELDVWGGQRRGVQSAAASLAAQVANYDDALVTLTGDVAAIYINIRALQEAIAVTRRNIDLQEQGLNLTQLRFDNGITTELDVQEATALLNDTRSLVPPLEAELAQAMNALGVLLAQPPSQLSARLGSGRIPVSRATVGVGIPAELLRRRPDIRVAEMEAAAQSAQIGVAINALYPQFGLSGDIGWQAADAADLFQPSSVTSLVVPGVGWNVLNYGRLKSNVRAQDAAFQGLVANYRNTVLSAYAEVENAMEGYEGARAQAAFLERSVAASRRASEIALSQYGDGVADYSRVLNTQRGALGAEAKLVQARAAVSSNLVSLYKALGGGWQIRNGREYLPNEVIVEMAYRTDWGDLVQVRQISR